jgi:hypothetical protein
MLSRQTDVLSRGDTISLYPAQTGRDAFADHRAFRFSDAGRRRIEALLLVQGPYAPYALPSTRNQS